MIANTGRAPVLSLLPALLVGLTVGAMQYALLAHVRPHAVAAQGEAGFRFYGSRFNGGTAQRSWRDFGHTLVNAAIRFAPAGPELVDVRLFAFDDEEQLVQVVWADIARPVEGGLELAGAFARWPADAEAGNRVALAVDPDWLSWAGVEARFVPQPVLQRIAEAKAGVPEQWAYRAALQERWAAIAGGVAMALLVASPALHWMAERRGLAVPLAILAAGYGLHMAGNVFSALGEYGRLSPMMSAWSLPVGVLALCLLTVLSGHGRVARRFRALMPGG